MWEAVVFVIAQGVFVATLVIFVRRFGAYTEALLKTHESNVLLFELTTKMLGELRKQREDLRTKGVA